MPNTLPAESVSFSQTFFAGTRSLTEALDALTHQAELQLGLVTESSVLGTAFYVGDGLQRAATDGVFDLFTLQTWDATNLLHLTSRTAEQAIDILRLLEPSQANLAWQELRNKLDVYVLVSNLSSILGLSSKQFIPLPELLQKAYGVPPFAALWAVEGVGHYYTDTYWSDKGIPQGLFFEAGSEIPQKSLLMLHAGMGLAFADRLLDTLLPDAPCEASARAAVQEFVSLCQKNARPGYLGAAIESLGLVTRDFYPDLLDCVHRQLLEIAPGLTGFFWHGVGRALYFSREFFLPVLSTVWRGPANEVRALPDQQSVMAGLAWAAALVNMRQPRIMEGALHSHIRNSTLQDGFSNGVASSIIMRQDTTPDEAFVSAFYQHRPADPGLLPSWDRLIAQPAGTALKDYYPVLKQHGALDQIFRYQNLAALTRQIQAGGVRGSVYLTA